MKNQKKKSLIKLKQTCLDHNDAKMMNNITKKIQYF